MLLHFSSRRAFSHGDVVVYGEMEEKEATWSRGGQTWSVLTEVKCHKSLLKLPVEVCPCVRGTPLEPSVLCVCVWGRVRKGVGWISQFLEQGEGGIAARHMPWDIEMAGDGQGKTRRISPVCLKERSCHVTHTLGGERSVSRMDFFVCVCMCAMWGEWDR